MKDSHVTQQCEHLKKLLATVQEQQTMQLKLIQERWEIHVPQTEQAWRGSIWAAELLFVPQLQTEQRDACQPGQDVHGEQQSHQPGQEHKKQGREREVHPAEPIYDIHVCWLTKELVKPMRAIFIV